MASENFKVLPKRVSAEIPPKNRLTKEQWDFYNENGYIVIKQLVDFVSLFKYKKRFQDICNGIIPQGFMTIQKLRHFMAQGAKPEEYVEKIQDILYDDVFIQFFEHPSVLDHVAQFIGEDITAIHSMLINKPPGTGPHPSHQDMYYFALRPIEKVIGVWTAIDDVTIDNGCLYVLPGTHRSHLHAHGRSADGPLGEKSKFYHRILDDSVEAGSRRVDLIMAPGDTVFFHPLLVHGSRENRSKMYRKAITSHYASTECQYIDPEGTVHENIANEIRREIKRRGVQLDFHDFFRARSKVVRGKSNL